MKLEIVLDYPLHFFSLVAITLLFWILTRSGKKRINFLYEEIRFRRSKKRNVLAPTLNSTEKSNGGKIGSETSPKLNTDRMGNQIQLQKVKLEWLNKPKKVLVVKKWKDSFVSDCFKQLVSWLVNEMNLDVIIEKDDEDFFPELDRFDSARENVSKYQIDLIICLGGDGTVLHTSSLFQCEMPPVMAFNLGSMGFLSPFRFKSFREDITTVLKGRSFLKWRMRLQCCVMKKDQEVATYHVLNEAVIDRGNSPFVLSLDCYCDDRMITTVHADGIIIATATGSTAYSLSAGGSLVHPMLPALLFTPICPHSLSFRPVILPASVLFKVQVPPESGCSAYVSFDGRSRHQLGAGDSVTMKSSEWHVPTVSQTPQAAEWFQSLAQHLNWNKRVKQKARS